MIRQTVLPFKLDRTDETLTAHGGLALLAEFTHGLGLRALVDRSLPQPRSYRGYAPSVVVETVILLLQAGGRTLEDLRELTREDALLTLLGQEAIPDPDTVGDWLRRMGDPQTGQLAFQLRAIDRTRIGERVGSLEPKDLTALEGHLRSLLSL